MATLENYGGELRKWPTASHKSSKNIINNSNNDDNINNLNNNNNSNNNKNNKNNNFGPLGEWNSITVTQQSAKLYISVMGHGAPGHA